MKERIGEVTSDLAAIGAEAKERFGSLSPTELNWQPAPKSWSVAQCLEHLIATHSLYFPLLQRLEHGTSRATFWERFSPFSGLWGRLLIHSMRPETRRKVKTMAKAEPSTSEIDARIVDRFVEHQTQMIDQLRRLPAKLDPAATIITSPLLGIVTYSLEQCFTIFVVHGQRHLGQAQRVTEVDGFPATQ